MRNQMKMSDLLEVEEKTTIEIPVAYVVGEYENGKKYVVLYNTKETDRALGKIGNVVQGDSLEDAKQKYL